MDRSCKKDDSGDPAAAAEGFYPDPENDTVDPEWKENQFKSYLKDLKNLSDDFSGLDANESQLSLSSSLLAITGSPIAENSRLTAVNSRKCQKMSENASEFQYLPNLIHCDSQEEEWTAKNGEQMDGDGAVADADEPFDMSTVVAVVVPASLEATIPVKTTTTWTNDNGPHGRKSYLQHPDSKYSQPDVKRWKPSTTTSLHQQQQAVDGSTTTSAGAGAVQPLTPEAYWTSSSLNQILNQRFPPVYLQNYLELEFDQKSIPHCEKLTVSRKPCGVCSNPSNDKIYVADRDYHQVAVYTRDGRFLKRFGHSEKFRPTGIQFDVHRNRLIISDKDNHRINFFTLEGKFISSFGSFGNENGLFNQPWGVCISPDGQKIAVADSKNHRVQLFDHEGNFINKNTEFEANPYEYNYQYNCPRAVAFDHDSNFLYVADINLDTIFKLDLTFTQRTQLTPPRSLGKPQGIAVDQSGKLFVCDSKNHCVRVISPNGEHLNTISSTGSTPISNPMDISVMHEGHILLLDNVETKETAYSRIRIF